MILGVDPGLTGAIAFLDDDGSLLDVVDMPCIDKRLSGALFRQLLEQYGFLPDVAIVEKVHTMPKQGVVSSGRFMGAYHAVLAVLEALGIPVEPVTATTWKRAMRVTADKETSRRKAIDRWPHQAGLFARKKDDGRAEAALIGLWWVET